MIEILLWGILIIVSAGLWTVNQKLQEIKRVREKISRDCDIMKGLLINMNRKNDKNGNVINWPY